MTTTRQIVSHYETRRLLAGWLAIALQQYRKKSLGSQSKCLLLVEYECTPALELTCVLAH